MTTDLQWKEWETKFRRMSAEQQKATLAALTPEQRLHFEQMQSQRAKSNRLGKTGLLIVLGIFVVPFVLWKIATYESEEDRQERRRRAREAYAQRKEREAEQLKIPTGRHSDAAFTCRDFVKGRLTSPKTAEFPSIWTGERKDAVYLGESKYLLESWVDAQNAFGVMLRTRYRCTILYDSGRWSLVDLNIGTEEIRAAQLDRDRTEAQRLEHLRIAEQSRLDAVRDTEEAKRREQLDAARIAREERSREQFSEAWHKRQEALLLERERQEAEARRIEREHHQKAQSWHQVSYLPGIALFKEALARFYDSYRAERGSINLTDVCKELKLQSVAVRRNRELMDSPDREINLRLQEMLGIFDAVAVACTNGRVTEMRSKLEGAEAAVGRLDESLARFSLAP